MTINGNVYKLLKEMYGLRDAGTTVDRKVLDVMNLMGVPLGKFRVCVGHRKVLNTLVRLVRSSDDFSLSGWRCFATHSETIWESTCWSRAVLGPNAEMGDVQEAIHLNRLLRLYPPGAERRERWEPEANPQHVVILVSQIGLGDESKAVSSG